MINLNNEIVENSEVIIYDMLENVVYKGEISSEKSTIDFSSYSNGVYQLVVKHDSEILFRQKIIKQ